MSKAERKPGFERRIALLIAVIVVLGSAFAALTTALVADHLLRAHEDTRLYAAAKIFALELSEAKHPIDEIVADETKEQQAAGIRVAVFEHGEFRSGDTDLPSVSHTECTNFQNIRACGAASTTGTIAVAAAPRAPINDRFSFLLAGLLAVFLVSVLGLLLSRRIARWAVEPIVRLEHAVAQVSPNAGASIDLGSADNIAEIDALRGAITSLAMRLFSALDQSRRFAGDAAHELRTPLTSILGELELLQEQVPTQGPIREGVDRVHITASRLAKLVEQLLILASSSEELQSAEDIQVDELLEDARLAMAHNTATPIIIDEKDSNTDQDIKIRGDRSLLISLLVNVLENARAYAPQGTIHMRYLVQDSTVVIQIDDEGAGISAEARKDVFRTFYRTPEARGNAHRGQGIGLALVAHVAKAHQGSVAFVDGAIGARFQLTLPYRAAQP
ncbi:MAG: HAMP domain-containing histidine kinase [Myxococcales bacterium]|nr:MAG: HAMP domain-containing histidine kinase [Myxococcales bacterium]